MHKASALPSPVVSWVVVWGISSISGITTTIISISTTIMQAGPYWSCYVFCSLSHQFIVWNYSCRVSGHWFHGGHSLWNVFGNSTNWLIGCMSISRSTVGNGWGNIGWGNISWGYIGWWDVWRKIASIIWSIKWWVSPAWVVAIPPAWEVAVSPVWVI